jgi:cation diffusion facilitator CzcD-associated flavoprotein CzcO
VTLVPELAKKAAHVTMLQRSPTYIVSVPGKDGLAGWFREHFSEDTAYATTRWKNVAFSLAFYRFCRRFPKLARRMLLAQVRKQLGDAVDVDPHFTPTYDPWDQRLCLVPDSDLFRTLRDKRASVVTDHIETFTEKGIELRSGRELEADLIVTATGLKLKFLGGVDVVVDGKRGKASEAMVYKGLMLSDVPNLAFAIGYTNASWTLKCDLASEYVCRLLGYMDAHGYAWCCPRRRDPTLEEEPLLDFTSGYVKRALADLPKQGSKTPWKLHQNYALDRALFRRGRLDDDAMEFAR